MRVDAARSGWTLHFGMTCRFKVFSVDGTRTAKVEYRILSAEASEEDGRRAG